MHETYERYVAGPLGVWPGYCEYNRETQQYRQTYHSSNISGWQDLTDLRLANLLRIGQWAHEILPDQQLPEGF